MIVARKFVPVVFAALLGLFAASGQKPAQHAPPKEQEPPEEDVTSQEKEYTFNPLQSASEVKIGLFYMKRGSFKAAAMRFEEATKWDPGSAEAYYRLGEAREKLKDTKGSTAAYTKFLELAPEDKNAASVRKKLRK